jgi:2-dehydropantoate 2-reductase
MESKYAKLLDNLANVLDAALGPEGTDSFAQAARAEAATVLRTAGIAVGAMGLSDPDRRRLMEIGSLPGAERVGSSSAQSLRRHAGSIETEQLNGEIVLLGRLNGIPTPVNEYLCALGRRLVREGLEPGSIAPGELRAALAPHVAGLR